MDNIFRVDRKITAPGAKPPKVRDSSTPSIGANLGVLGYPGGLIENSDGSEAVTKANVFQSGIPT